MSRPENEKWKVSVTFPDVILLDQKRFAQVAVVNSARDGWQQRAALVAAAPEMLAACKALASADTEDDIRTAHFMARQAIEKAEGGKS